MKLVATKAQDSLYLLFLIFIRSFTLQFESVIHTLTLYPIVMTDKINIESSSKLYSYQVDEPIGDSGLFVNFLKYSTFFVLIWWFSWVIIMFKLFNQNSLFIWFADHPYLTNTLLTLAIFSYFIAHIRKKYRHGEPFELIIDDNQKLLEVKVKNTFDGTIQVKKIPFQNLVVHIDIKDNKKSMYKEFIEIQKTIRILNNDKLETLMNIQMTAWCRHPDIDNIVETLKSRAKNNLA